MENIKFKVNGISFDFIYCLPGSFSMGSEKNERGRWSIELLHQVTLSRGFWILKGPLSVAQWYALGMESVSSLYENSLLDKKRYRIMGENSTHAEMWQLFQSHGLLLNDLQYRDIPITMVRWYDAKIFCQTLSCELSSELEAVLPSEAQWEYACKAAEENSKNKEVWSGETESAKNSYVSHAGLPSDMISRPIGPYQIGRSNSFNSRGLSDMLGNVWEWTNDWFGEYSAAEIIDPRGPAHGDTKVPRGGCWIGPQRTLRAANRGKDDPSVRTPFIGFRPVIIKKEVNYYR